MAQGESVLCKLIQGVSVTRTRNLLSRSHYKRLKDHMDRGRVELGRDDRSLLRRIERFTGNKASLMEIPGLEPRRHG